MHAMATHGEQRVWFKGPKTPHWGCPGCGEAENYACRIACFKCGKSAPERIVAAAKRADKAARDKGGGGTAWQGGKKGDSSEVARLKESVAKLLQRLKAKPGEDGFEVVRTKKQKKAERKKAQEAGRTDAQPEAAEAPAKAAAPERERALEKLVKSLEASAGVDEGAAALLDVKRKELQALREQKKASIAAAKPWKPVADLEHKRRQKQRALEQARSSAVDARARFAQWQKDIQEQSAAKEAECANLEAEAVKAEVEFSQADRTYCEAAKGLAFASVGSASGLREVLLDIGGVSSPELAHAYAVSTALIKDAALTASERAKVIDGGVDALASTPEPPVGFEEERLLQQIEELDRQSKATI